MLRGLVVAIILLFTCAAGAHAQSLSGYFAGGTAIEGAAEPIDTFGNGTYYNTPKMGGFFETIGADFMFFHSEKFGIGGEYTFRKDRGPYAGLEYQPKFYDLNAVYEPLTFAGRFTPIFQLGAGRASLSIYDTLAACLKLPQGCAGENEQSVNINDLQAHASAVLCVPGNLCEPAGGRALGGRQILGVLWKPVGDAVFSGGRVYLPLCRQVTQEVKRLPARSK